MNLNVRMAVATFLWAHPSDQKFPRFLLMFHRRGTWELPGGKVKPGETFAQAAGREIREETKFKLVNPVMIVGVVSNLTADDNTFGMVYFRCPVIPMEHIECDPAEYPVPALSKEHTDYAWVTLEEATRLYLEGMSPRLRVLTNENITAHSSSMNALAHRDPTTYVWYAGEDPKIGLPERRRGY